VVRANAQAGFENVTLWHERDISHSSVERVILADSSILTDYMLGKAHWLIDGLVVNAKRMRDNYESLGGVTASGQILLELTRKGVSREDAYAIVQPLAMRVWDEGAKFDELVRQDERITAKLSKEEIDAVFDVKHQLRNVDKIFKRVFSS
jgi:adenylosuccinate lyase